MFVVRKGESLNLLQLKERKECGSLGRDAGDAQRRIDEELNPRKKGTGIP